MLHLLLLIPLSSARFVPPQHGRYGNSSSRDQVKLNSVGSNLREMCDSLPYRTFYSPGQCLFMISSRAKENKDTACRSAHSRAVTIAENELTRDRLGKANDENSVVCEISQLPIRSTLM